MVTMPFTGMTTLSLFVAGLLSRLSMTQVYWELEPFCGITATMLVTKALKLLACRLTLMLFVELLGVVPLGSRPHETFSSAVPAPPNWFIFMDPPAHTKLRALISRAFTPRMIVNLEPLIRDLSRELLDRVMHRGEMDVAADFSVPLAIRVIATMIGIPADDWPRFKRWSDGILKLSYARSGGQEAQEAGRELARTASTRPKSRSLHCLSAFTVFPTQKWDSCEC